MTNEKSDITVLIVDDEDEIRAIVGYDIRKRGYRCLFAINGADAYDIVLKENPLIVVSDIRMPGGGGIDLLAKLRKRDSRLPYVILSTGYADITIEDAIDAGAEALFVKPFDRKRLMECVDELSRPLEERWAQRRLGGSRKDTQIRVNVSIGGLTDTQSSQILNMGLGGFFLAKDKDFPRCGEIIEFRIEIPEIQAPIEGLGIVRWVRETAESGLRTGCGVQFVELSNSTRSNLIELLNALKTYAVVPRS